MQTRIALLALCAAVGLIAYVILHDWSFWNAPSHKRFERLWTADIATLESSGKLPAPWKDVKEVVLYGGTPQAKDWIARIQPPIQGRTQGGHRLEVLIVPWEEEGIHGVLVQYNLVELKSGNNIWELGRTIYLGDPKAKSGFKAWVENLRQ